METKLYYHKTDGGAEYLFDTFIECDNGHKEGAKTDKTKYTIRIDGEGKKGKGNKNEWIIEHN